MISAADSTQRIGSFCAVHAAHVKDQHFVVGQPHFAAQHAFLDRFGVVKLRVGAGVNDVEILPAAAVLFLGVTGQVRVGNVAPMQRLVDRPRFVDPVLAEVVQVHQVHAADVGVPLAPAGDHAVAHERVAVEHDIDVLGDEQVIEEGVDLFVAADDVRRQVNRVAHGGVAIVPDVLARHFDHHVTRNGRAASRPECPGPRLGAADDHVRVR